LEHDHRASHACAEVTRRVDRGLRRDEAGYSGRTL
jgi:hypothetical protein